MSLPWVLSEVQRRQAQLRAEVDARRLGADQNIDDQGIHQSQILALDTMLTTLLAAQATLLTSLTPNLPATIYATTYQNLLLEIAGTQGLWRLFRLMFDQRLDPRAKPALDAADLIAENCYRPCIEQARSFGLIDAQFREPPLTYLDAELSALTASRGVEARALGLSTGKYRAMRLPIPIILLPADQLESLWLFTTLHHEVGHNLDQDVRRAGTGERISEELRRRLIERLSASGATPARRQVWGRWCEEIVADAFGVLLGGAGFGYTLASLLLPTAASASSVQTRDDHPDSFVRLHLLAAMLKACNQPQLNSVAAWVLAQAGSLPQPTDLASFLGEASTVATLAINTPLDVLGGRKLAELVPTLADDLRRTDELATPLGNLAQGQVATLPNPAGFPIRLVPAAAQLALANLPQPTPAQLATLHTAALGFLQSIERPAFLGGDGPSPAFLRELVGKLKFGVKK